MSSQHLAYEQTYVLSNIWDGFYTVYITMICIDEK